MRAAAAETVATRWPNAPETALLLREIAIVGNGEDRRNVLLLLTGLDTALELVDSRATSNGVTIQVYRPSGRPQYATATPDPKQ